MCSSTTGHARSASQTSYRGPTSLCLCTEAFTVKFLSLNLTSSQVSEMWLSAVVTTRKLLSSCNAAAGLQLGSSKASAKTWGAKKLPLTQLGAGT